MPPVFATILLLYSGRICVSSFLGKNFVGAYISRTYAPESWRYRPFPKALIRTVAPSCYIYGGI